MTDSAQPRRIEILMIEDSATDRLLTVEALRESRIANTVHHVSDGEQAMQYLRKEGDYANAVVPDLILLDLNLPRKDGREVLAEIKADDFLRLIPVVVLTTSRSEEDVLGAYGVHANCYIAKPLDFSQFGQVIQRLENFWFEVVTLPSVDAAEQSRPKAPKPASGRVSTTSQPPITHYRALLVEDSPSDRLIIKAALAQSHQCVFAIDECDRVSNAREALQVQKYDVVISDLSLPDSEGMETVRQLVQHAAGVPLVVLTVLDDDETGAQALREGAVDYVVKGEVEGRGLARAIRFAVDRNQIEEQMRHAQRMESLGVLAGGIAHDFNNLLMVVRGNAELQLRTTREDPKVERTANQILIATDRASRLTRQLLAFGRRESMQQTSVDLNETVSEFAKMVKRLLGPTIELKLELAVEQLPVLADAGLLEQVIMNLSVNARDAMPEGGTLTIASSAVMINDDRPQGLPPAGVGPYAQLRVEDTGAGIPGDVINRIFEPFFTTKAVGHGTGLGLSTAHGIVRQHRGSLEVESELGSGSIFTVLLPLETVKKAAESDVDSALPSGAGETILVVDDEHMVRELTMSFLELHGYRVREASSGAEVIARWDELKQDLDMVLTDIIMPNGVSGRELGVWLHEQQPDLKVVYCSGFSHTHLNRKSQLKEGENFLSKPYSVSQLLNLVSKTLAR